jgi:glycosyltransferase involved in cell wall biosynthesis
MLGRFKIRDTRNLEIRYWLVSVNPRREAPIRMPMLTIAIPTLNGAQFLREAIESASTQARSLDVEVLVLDNCSTDDTPKIIERLKDSGLVFNEHRNNTQLTSAQNFLEAVRQSSGEYVWFLADDDVLVPNAIEIILNVINLHGPSVIVSNNQPVDENLGLLVVDDIGPRGLHDVSIDNYSAIISSGPQALLEIGWDKIGLLSANCFKRESFLAESGGSNQPPEFDFLYIIPAMMSDGKSVYVSDPLILFRQYSKRWQTKNDNSQLMEIDWLEIPTILSRLSRRGYPRKVIARIQFMRSLVFLFHVGIAKVLGFRASVEFLKRFVYVNRGNFFLMLQIPILWLPARLLKRLGLLYKTPVAGWLKSRLKIDSYGSAQ